MARSGWKHRLSDIDRITETATCAVCGSVGVYLNGGTVWVCRKARNERKVRARDKTRKGLYKPRPGTKVKFSKLRGKHCEICGATENLCGDHDHLTQKFRGTLCRLCNIGLGMYRDSIVLLEQAITYLKTKSSGPRER